VSVLQKEVVSEVTVLDAKRREHLLLRCLANKLELVEFKLRESDEGGVYVDWREWLDEGAVWLFRVGSAADDAPGKLAANVLDVGLGEVGEFLTITFLGDFFLLSLGVEGLLKERCVLDVGFLALVSLFTVVSEASHPLEIYEVLKCGR
jgi:hypothetical protein